MAQRLHDWSNGKKIVDYKVLRNPGGRYDPTGCKGPVINGVYRRGKRLIFDLDNGISAVCHNAMSGFWDTSDEPWTFDYVEGKRESKTTDVRLEFELDSGRVLRFHDARLFGSLSTCPTPLLQKMLEKVGAEAIRTPRMLPDSPVFNILDSAVFLSGKKPIKQLLLEQERIAGVGNIYAAEALWRAQIHPSRLGVSLKGDDHQRLLECVQSVLKDALAYGLRYDEYLKVYRREFCKNCGNKIGKIDIAKRTTYFCVHCQQ
jgi:formamidopyrimidine-DNA glycosylase